MKFRCIPYILALTLLLKISYPALSCTGITLKSADGGIVVARTVEWALNDAQHNKLLIVPRNKEFKGQTPEGLNGYKWRGKYGFVTMTAYGQPYGPDGMNEKGLYVGVYYLPGFAEYSVYTKDGASVSMSVGDFMQWMLSSFQNVEEILDKIHSVRVVSVENKDFGGAELPFHFKIADASGKSKIIEIVNKGEIKIYEPYLGVITNSPTYDWHIINQRNYLNLSTNPSSKTEAGSYALAPLGGGSGLLGLPGDFTPPSRFVRASVYTASCRPLSSATEAVFEAFRILDNFNIPLGAQVPADKLPQDIVSATQITSASDLTNKVYYYHTMWNRQIRKIDLKSIDFTTVKEQIIDDDATRTNTVKDLSPMVGK